MMGLWFCASALGNLAAGLIGGHVKADQLDMLPDLFARCSVALLICAAVLIVLIVPIRRMLENTQSRARKTGDHRLTDNPFYLQTGARGAGFCLQDHPVAVRIFKGLPRPIPIGVIGDDRQESRRPHPLTPGSPFVLIRQVKHQQMILRRRLPDPHPRCCVNSRW